MAVILGKIKDFYDFVFHDLVDHRSKDMYPSPLFIITMIPFYVYFCNSLGPRLMKDRKPFKLKTTIMIYNIFQIFISIYIFYLGLTGGWINGYNWMCQPVDMTDNPVSRRMLKAAWWYTMIKIVDWMDTVFFILRKKDNQLTFLHIFHHAAMPAAAYGGLKYFPNGHATLLGVINSLVHAIMYTYYFLAGLGPRYQKYLWWKKHLTTLQLIQFSFIFIHNLIPLVVGGCGYPRWISWLLCAHTLQFIYMFGKFYYNSYVKKPEKKNSNGQHLNGKSKVH